ncbi:hypothetical protein CK203_074582 [Vitis vinifera]|uniref:Uncharacterized protein n=1 Tax=Vitis vinifera TaxID=29760 RepID=A0A438ESF5_VITVI|nr:hypothetical protein CK203_074582 [Vitis vinifera]
MGSSPSFTILLSFFIIFQLSYSIPFIVLHDSVPIWTVDFVIVFSSSHEFDHGNCNELGWDFAVIAVGLKDEIRSGLVE